MYFRRCPSSWAGGKRRGSCPVPMHVGGFFTANCCQPLRVKKPTAGCETPGDGVFQENMEQQGSTRAAGKGSAPLVSERWTGFRLSCARGGTLSSSPLSPAVLRCGHGCQAGQGFFLSLPAGVGDPQARKINLFIFKSQKQMKRCQPAPCLVESMRSPQPVQLSTDG